MSINLKIPDIRELKPRITVFGVGGAGGNAVNNMITAGLVGVDFVVANTDAQALTMSKAERIIQMGVQVTEGLGAGSQPEVGRAAAEEVVTGNVTVVAVAFARCGLPPVVAKAAAQNISKRAVQRKVPPRKLLISGPIESSVACAWRAENITQVTNRIGDY